MVILTIRPLEAIDYVRLFVAGDCYGAQGEWGRIPPMWTKLKVGDVKCVDDGKTRGVHIACGHDGHSFVTLIFDKAIPHEQTDELERQLRKMKLTEVIVDTP
jgi:hypothetical protein